jgi:hypothetical protein
MKERKEWQEGLSARREPYEHAPAVALASNSPDEAAGLHAIDELDGAVVLDLQTLRQETDGRLPTFRHAFEGEKKLVLLRLKARRTRGSFAEAHEPAELIAKLGQRLILGHRERLGRHVCSYIVLR